MAGSEFLIQQLERWIAPWKRRILCMIGKCIISAVNDSREIQTTEIQYLSGKTIANVERLQEYGFTSVPPSDSEGAVLFLGGNQQHGIVVATDSSQYRLKGLPGGAVALYNDSGDYVKLTYAKIEVHADEITLGDGSSFKRLMNEEMISPYNTHTHTDPASGSTGPPNNLLNVASHATSKTKAE